MNDLQPAFYRPSGPRKGISRKVLARSKVLDSVVEDVAAVVVGPVDRAACLAEKTREARCLDAVTRAGDSND